MLSQMGVLDVLSKIIQKENVVSIAGESGTGKTALAMYLIGNLILNGTHEHNTIWVQASESFSKKRLEKMYECFPERKEFLKNQILVTPKNFSCRNLDELKKSVKNVIDLVSKIPFKFIVVDNISHHLRFEISKNNDMGKKVLVYNKFFNDLLLPLIMSCQMKKIKLILIHEVSFNPGLKKTVSYFHKLFDRIKSIQIFLTKNPNPVNNQSVMKISNNNEIILNTEYRIVDKGFLFINFKKKKKP